MTPPPTNRYVCCRPRDGIDGDEERAVGHKEDEDENKAVDSETGVSAARSSLSNLGDGKDQAWEGADGLARGHAAWRCIAFCMIGKHRLPAASFDFVDTEKCPVERARESS